MPAFQFNEPRMIRTALLRGSRAATFLAAMLAFGAGALAQEAAVTRRATELRETPADGGRSLAALPERTPLTRLAERSGPWVQVRTGSGATGWLHLFDLAPAAGARTDSGGGVGDALRGVTGLFGRPATTTTATSASGIRGLDAEDLAQAQPDSAALRRVQGWRQSEADARAFGDRAALRPVAVEPLPAPQRPAAAGGGHPANPESP